MAGFRSGWSRDNFVHQPLSTSTPLPRQQAFTGLGNVSSQNFLASLDHSSNDEVSESAFNNMIDQTNDGDFDYNFEDIEYKSNPLNNSVFNQQSSTSLPVFDSDYSKNIPERSVTINTDDLFSVYDNSSSSRLEFSDAIRCATEDNHVFSGSMFNPEPDNRLGGGFSNQSILSSSTNSFNDDCFKVPAPPPPRKRRESPSSAESPDSVKNASNLDAETTAKLLSFSNRLKSLKSPAAGTPITTPSGRTTPRSGMLTPRNRTPEPASSAGGNTSSRLASHRPEPSCFVSVFEGSGGAAGEVGVAAISLISPCLILCQFSDTKTYPRTITKLLTINPSIVLVPDSNNVKLYDDIADKLPLAKVLKVQRKYFSESRGLQMIQHLIVPQYSSVEMQFHNKYYCLAAANALLKYVEQAENFYIARKSLKVDYQVAEKSTIIDPATAENIELLNSLGTRHKKGSLFGVLNKCSSNSGVRLLRANLYQPPIDAEVINNRLEFVDELVTDVGFFNSLKNVVNKFPDLDPVLTLCVKRTDDNNSAQKIESKINNMISLKQILQLLPQLYDILSKSKTRIAVEVSKMLKGHVNISSLLLEMMHLVLMENINIGRGGGAVRFSRAMAVKSEVNGLLDISRRTFCEYVEQLENYVRSLAEDTSLPLKLIWSNKGFCIQIVNNKNCPVDVNTLPKDFYRVVKNKSGITFVTQDFSVKDILTKSSLDEINRMSNAVLNELLNEVREYIGFLYTLSENLANMDMLLSFATVTLSEELVKPEFGDKMMIQAGRHPLLEQFSVDVTPNNINIDHLNRLQILTGPNMSGKSTYLRQVVLLTIMAQIGCFVPAQFARFRITDRIFSRVSNRDCMETNSSTFMVEMKETAFILSNAGHSSLVIIDELGRGTSVDEGAAICWTVCEALLKTSAFVLIATHFPQMKQLTDFHPCVENFEFLTYLEDNRPVFTHQLVRVSSSNDDTRDTQLVNYGLELASSSALPANIVEKAKQLSKKFRAPPSHHARVNHLDQLCVNYIVKLKKLTQMGLTKDEVKSEMKVIKEAFLRESKQLVEQAENCGTSTEAPASDVNTGENIIDQDQGEEEGSGKENPVSIFHVPEIDDLPSHDNTENIESSVDIEF